MEGLTNSQEPKKEPKDIFEFLESVFGHEIFFIENLMALDQRNKELLYKFLGVKVENIDKRSLSLYVNGLARKHPFLKKFPFIHRNALGNTINITALRISSASQPPLNRETALRAFLSKFPDPVGGFPASQYQRRDKLNLTEEENNYYKELRDKVKQAIEHKSYFELADCPPHIRRLRILSKFKKLGLIKLRKGQRISDFSAFEFPEEEDKK